MKSWTFETQEIANTFDNHVREQLPWYDMVTESVAYIIKNYLSENDTVVDIGASTGNMIEKILPLVEERSCYITAIEKSESMFEKLKNKYANESCIELVDSDVMDIELPKAKVYILFLTLMFIPVQQRQKLINRIKNKCEEGGIIIIVDKVCDHVGYFSTVLKRLTMHIKLLQGAKPEDVLIKEMSLAGIQIPIDVELLGNAKQFFRMGEFAGWVIEC
jgi:tRNA (cmo5U34)-methyltransferase